MVRLAGRHSRWLKGGLVGSLLHSLRFNRYAEPLPPLSWRGLSELWYDKLADLQYPTNHLDGVRFVPLRRSPAISRRLRHTTK